MSEYKGIKDEPITTLDQDSLGLTNHANILSKFIQNCDTPMTIAIQGDWGSGKTSMMELIKNNLCPSSFPQPNSTCSVHPIWFNTWQYAQLNMQDSLSISLLSNFLEQLSEIDKKNDKITQIKDGLMVAGLLAIKMGAKVSADVDVDFDDFKKTKSIDSAKIVNSLKEDIKDIVNGIVADSQNEIKRFVIFIDVFKNIVLLT